ncbi:MAG: DUF2029 domain-containing protein [Anaerolineae bacterium]|nr:DUF2029 domain-containing protein [Anaerolineae bacterium]
MIDKVMMRLLKDNKAAMLLALLGGIDLLWQAPIRYILDGGLLTDFRSFYFAGRAIFGEGNIYDHNYLIEYAKGSGYTGYVFSYVYPPSLAFYSAPLWHRLNGREAALLWMLLSIVLGVFILVAVTHLISTLSNQESKGKNSLLPWLSLFLLVILPFGNNLRLGQVNSVVLAFISASLVLSLHYKRDLLAGFLLAPAILIKMTPLGLLLYFILNKHYKTLYGCIVGIIVLSIPTFVTSQGLKSWEFFLDFANMMDYGQTMPGLPDVASVPNFSVAGWMARLSMSQPAISLMTKIGLSILGLGLIWQHWRLRQRDDGKLLLLPYLVLMIIASPFTYLHHVIYIYPGLLLTIWTVWDRSCRLRVPLLIGLISLTIIAGIDLPSLYNDLGLNITLLRSINLYALLCLFGIGLMVPELCTMIEE